MSVRSLEEDLLTLFSSTGTVKVIGCTLLQAVEFKRVDAAVPLLSGDLPATQHCFNIVVVQDLQTHARTQVLTEHTPDTVVRPVRLASGLSTHHCAQGRQWSTAHTLFIDTGA